MNDSKKRSSFFLTLFSYRAIALIIIILFLITICSFLLPNFFTFANLKVSLLALTDKGIIVIGTTLLLVGGLIDLSVGSIFGFAAMLTALLIKANFPVSVAITIGLLSGISIGFLNGIIIEKLKVNFLITTLATLGIFRGLIFLLSQQSVTALPSNFTQIGKINFLNIQLPVWYMIILLIICGIFIARHRFFRQYYYIGINRKTALLSGIRVSTLSILAFMICGFLAGLSGIIYTARSGAATSTMGLGLNLKVIAGAVLGGCSLGGGEGSIFGSFLGILLMELIIIVLVFAKVVTYWHDIVTGMVLIIAVVFDQWVKAKREELQSKST